MPGVNRLPACPGLGAGDPSRPPRPLNGFLGPPDNPPDIPISTSSSSNNLAFLFQWVNLFLPLLVPGLKLTRRGLCERSSCSIRDNLA